VTIEDDRESAKTNPFGITAPLALVRAQRSPSSKNKPISTRNEDAFIHAEFCKTNPLYAAFARIFARRGLIECACPDLTMTEEWQTDIRPNLQGAGLQQRHPTAVGFAVLAIENVTVPAIGAIGDQIAQHFQSHGGCGIRHFYAWLAHRMICQHFDRDAAQRVAARRDLDFQVPALRDPAARERIDGEATSTSIKADRSVFIGPPKISARGSK
jgi:hypothetical protein